MGDNQELEALLQSTEDVKPGYVTPYPGSGPALSNLVPAFTSPTRSWVMASPGYGSGASRDIGNKVLKVPLRKDYTHDVQAMIKADPNAGAYYICNPNNPTGTLTPRKDLEYILANKKKDAVLIIDEAYIHFSGRDHMSTDLVKADKDVIVLRTFSKIYGMAGMRAGAAFRTPGSVGAPGQVRPDRQSVGDDHGVRRGEHESQRHGHSGADRDQQEESRTGVRDDGQTGRVLHSVGVELLHDVGEGHDRDAGRRRLWRRRRFCWPAQPVAGMAAAHPRDGRHLRGDDQVQRRADQVLKEGPPKA